MGLANKIPGVSGGIVALIAGFYQELIETFKSININSLILIKNGRFRDFFKTTNSKFLLCIFSGVIFSFFSVSLILDYYMIHYDKQVLGLFFGMILSSVYFIVKKISNYYRLKNIAITISCIRLRFFNPTAIMEIKGPFQAPFLLEGLTLNLHFAKLALKILLLDYQVQQLS